MHRATGSAASLPAIGQEMLGLDSGYFDRLEL